MNLYKKVISYIVCAQIKGCTGGQKEYPFVVHADCSLLPYCIGKINRIRRKNINMSGYFGDERFFDNQEDYEKIRKMMNNYLEQLVEKNGNLQFIDLIWLVKRNIHCTKQQSVSRCL